MIQTSRYRDPKTVRDIIAEIRSRATRRWHLMEVCGGQTRAILHSGIDELLHDAIELHHGPGCPVCVTPAAIIDHAIEIASRSPVILCSFGDMVRVPGSKSSLGVARAHGGDIRVVSSPIDAVQIARENPTREVVFFGVGFETTAPSVALAILLAANEELENFSVLASHVLVPPALSAIMETPGTVVEGFLAAGHVCAVMGYQGYESLAEQYRIPIVVTGFEPVDLLNGILACIRQLEAGRWYVENQYHRAVSPHGNTSAQQAVDEVFEVIPRSWRGLGELEDSGLGIRAAYRFFDATNRFTIADQHKATADDCISGLVLIGKKRPTQCPAFGTRCTPDHPLGATMVSDEGACAAYYAVQRSLEPHTDLESREGAT